MTPAWRSFTGFSVLSVVLLALVPALSVVTGASMDFPALAARASEVSGVAWTSNLWNVVRLARVEPGLFLLLLGSLVPTLAALGMIVVQRGRRGVAAWLRRLHPFGRAGVAWGPALGAYGGLVALLVVCGIVTFLVRDALAPGAYRQAPDLLSLGVVPALLAAAFLDQGAVLEEPGWRGYGTPLLQGAGVRPVTAAFLIGVVWGLWHVPRDVVSGLPAQLGLPVYLFWFLPAFVFGCVAASIVAAFFVNRLHGSVVPAIVVHGLANDAVGISGLATIERALTPAHQLTRALPLCAVALALVWWTGGRLGWLGDRHPAPDAGERAA